jgi:hypothetical protein
LEKHLKKADDDAKIEPAANRTSYPRASKPTFNLKDPVRIDNHLDDEFYDVDYTQKNQNDLTLPDEFSFEITELDQLIDDHDKALEEINTQLKFQAAGTPVTKENDKVTSKPSPNNPYLQAAVYNTSPDIDPTFLPPTNDLTRAARHPKITQPIGTFDAGAQEDIHHD